MQLLWVELDWIRLDEALLSLLIWTREGGLPSSSRNRKSQSRIGSQCAYEADLDRGFELVQKSLVVCIRIRIFVAYVRGKR